MQRDLRRLNAEMLQQHSRVSRILRRDQGTVLQGVARAHTQIAQIADRRGYHVEPPRTRRADRSIFHYNSRLFSRSWEPKGMAAILRRPRALCALAVSLLAPACSLVNPVVGPTEKQEQAARLVRDGKHAEAARAYASLGTQLPAENDNYEVLSAEQWVAAGYEDSAKQAFAQVSAE